MICVRWEKTKSGNQLEGICKRHRMRHEELAKVSEINGEDLIMVGEARAERIRETSRTLGMSANHEHIMKGSKEWTSRIKMMTILDNHKHTLAPNIYFRYSNISYMNQSILPFNSRCKLGIKYRQ